MLKVLLLLLGLKLKLVLKLALVVLVLVLVPSLHVVVVVVLSAPRFLSPHSCAYFSFVSSDAPADARGILFPLQCFRAALLPPLPWLLLGGCR